MRTQLLSFLLLLFGVTSAGQELHGPDRTLPGTLATFEIVPAQEASWLIVTPQPDTVTYQVDTGLAKFYCASPRQGQYTIVAGIVDAGQPRLLVKTFVNGEEDVKPTPLPPVPPSPSSLETWIKTQMPILVRTEHFATESRLVADCFEQIVRRIDEKNIKTAQNAQVQLQIALTASLALTSPTAVTDWTPFLTELSRRLESELAGKINDLAEVKKTFQTACDAMRSLKIPESVTNRTAPPTRIKVNAGKTLSSAPCTLCP